MNGTPRLRSAFPSTPSSSRKLPAQHASSSAEASGKVRDINVLTSSKPDPDAPLIPFDKLDAPSQRFYVAGCYFALLCWRLYDFYHLTLDETESLWLFMKWVTIDGTFLFGLPGMRIPWLEWSSTTMTVLFAIHSMIDGILMFRIPIPLGVWILALSRVLYDKELAISERYVKAASILHDQNLILGRTVINILPEGSAVLNPDQKPLSLDTSKYSDSVNLPIHINQTVPISIELIRYDLETGQNETITINASQAKKLRNEAEKLQPRSNDGPLLMYYPVKKTGLYKLQRVIDETKLEVRGRSFEALVVARPSARVKTTGLDRCRGDLSDLSIEVEGTPPLKVKYRKTVNGEDRDISYQSIQPEEFTSPLVRQTGTGPLVIPGEVDLSWAKLHRITVPLNETLIASGAWSYSIDEVTDGCGNTVTYASQDGDYERSKPKSGNLEQALIVHDRPRASLKTTDLQRPLRAGKGQSVDLPLKFSSTGKNNLPDGEYTLEYLFTRGDDMLPNAEHSIEAESRTVTMKNIRTLPQIKEPGLYTLRSVSTQFCAGEILEPASVMLVNPPEPQLAVVEEEITDKCAGRPIGLRINLDFVGTPPFDVEYFIQKKSNQQVQYKRIEGLRGHLDFKPEVAGRYTYKFNRISDAVYKNVPLRDVSFEQDVKPSVSAQFTDPSAKTSICIDQSVRFDVRLQGEAPFALEYEIVHNGKRQKNLIEDITNSVYTIETGQLTSGGEYSVALISVRDTMGCKESLQQDVKISVRQQKPKASFGTIEGKRSIQSLESKYLNIPLRLSGEAPWTIWYRDPQGMEHSKKTSNANDFISVRDVGTYEIARVNDGLCPGAVDPLAGSFDVSWIARPTVNVPENSLVEGPKGKMMRNDVCEGEEDSLEILFTGRPPFEVKYQEQIRPDSGSKSIRNKEMNVPLQSAHINLNTGQAGNYEYTFQELGDYNYDHDQKKHKQLVIQQRVNPKPSVGFVNPGKVYSFCQGETTGKDSELVPITLTGQPPFTVDVEIRQRTKASKPYTHTVSNIPATSHKLQIPHDRLQPGNSALSIRRVRDARGCERFMDYTVAPRVQIAVHDPPTITPLESRTDFCVGDRISFALSGVAPYSVFYEFEKASRKAMVQTGTFKRLAENPGNFTIVGVQDNASSCRTRASLTNVIHPMPSVRLSKGKINRVDIHAGSEVDLNFDFGGTPPFEFTYTRSENSKKTGRPGTVLETRTLTSDSSSLTTKASEEGTYEVVAIRDAFCSFAKPGAEGFAGAGSRKLLT